MRLILCLFHVLEHNKAKLLNQETSPHKALRGQISLGDMSEV